MPNVYLYEKCSTCRNAMKWLDHAGIRYKTIPIKETPPTKSELKRAIRLVDGNFRKLFNTSGMDYRALGLKDKMPTLTEAEAIELLHGNGMLVKRPFVLDGDTLLVGFKADEWQRELGT